MQRFQGSMPPTPPPLQPLHVPSVLILWTPTEGPQGQSGYSRPIQESNHTWDRGKQSACYVDSNVLLTETHRARGRFATEWGGNCPRVSNLLLWCPVTEGGGIKKHAQYCLEVGDLGTDMNVLLGHNDWTHCEIVSESHCKCVKSETLVQQRQGN